MIFIFVKCIAAIYSLTSDSFSMTVVGPEVRVEQGEEGGGLLPSGLLLCALGYHTSTYELPETNVNHVLI